MISGTNGRARRTMASRPKAISHGNGNHAMACPAEGLHQQSERRRGGTGLDQGQRGDGVRKSGPTIHGELALWMHSRAASWWICMWLDARPATAAVNRSSGRFLSRAMASWGTSG